MGQVYGIMLLLPKMVEQIKTEEISTGAGGANISETNVGLLWDMLYENDMNDSGVQREEALDRRTEIMITRCGIIDVILEE